MSAAVCLTVLLLSPALGAGRPDWVDRRPAHPDYYYGVGVCDRKDLDTETCMARADARALADLASAISVEIKSEFLDRIVESDAVVRETAQAEIAAQTAATLTGHDLVGRWQDRRQCWACYRLSRATHARQTEAARRDAVAGARRFAESAARAEQEGDLVSAIRLRLQDPALVRTFVGRPTGVSTDPEPVALATEAIASLQRQLGSIRLLPDRERLPVLAGQPMNETLAVSLPSGRPLPNLPLRFSGAPSLTASGQTDADGRAAFHAPTIAEADVGKRILAEPDLVALYTNQPPKGLAAIMLSQLTVPRASALLSACADATDFAWRREFEGFPAQVVAVYRAGGDPRPWPKMRDEVAGFLQAKGARASLTHAAPLSAAEALTYTANPEARPAASRDGLLAVLVADGTLNRRRGEAGGEECQFSGEIRLVFSRAGRQVFVSRFQGTGGWNPMGESMCMDVLALNVVKRWQAEHLRRLTGKVEP